MTTADDLRAARNLIERPEAWTKGVVARDTFGSPITPDSSDAVCWCAYGALAKVTRSASPDYDAATAMLRKVVRADTVSGFNDTHTHAEVLAAFDRAIALAESQGGTK